MGSSERRAEDSLTTAKPLVSAIIATHNYGHYLSTALDSILVQEGLHHQFEVEIIVVDDASTDATAEVVQRYPEVRYLRHAHRQGVSAARNTGIRACKGEFVSFLDADDTWLPPKLRLQIPRLVSNPQAGVVYSQGIRHGAGDDAVFPPASNAPSGNVFEAMLDYNFAVHGGCLLIRREAFDKVGCFDESLRTAEDLDLAFRLAFHFQFLFEPAPVMIYNISPTGLWLTSAALGAAESDHARVVERALRMLPDSPRFKEMREEAPVRWAFHSMFPFVLIGQFPEARSRMLAALRANPSSGRYAWVRHRVKWATHKIIVHAASPRAEAHALCGEIESMLRDADFEGRRSLQWILAEIWADVFLSGPLRIRVGSKAAAYAALRAFKYAPSRAALAHRIGRTFLSRIRNELRGT